MFSDCVVCCCCAEKSTVDTAVRTNLLRLPLFTNLRRLLLDGRFSAAAHTKDHLDCIVYSAVAVESVAAGWCCADFRIEFHYGVPFFLECFFGPFWIGSRFVYQVRCFCLLFW